LIKEVYMMNALMGGVLIGLAVSLMLLFNGRVTGISGILGGLLRPKVRDVGWRLSFILGLILGGFVLKTLRPDVFLQANEAFWFDYVIAGFLVGFGTLLGNGCTSGHGVCGLSRLSMRSFLATITFILFGMISVYLFRIMRGSL